MSSDDRPTLPGVAVLVLSSFALGASVPYSLYGPFRLLEKLDWGNVGEWVSGIGAFAAAAIALHIGLRPERRDQRTRRRRARILAFQLNREVTLTLGGLKRLLLESRDWAPALVGKDAEHARYLRSLLGEYGIDTLKSNYELLEQLPYELGVRIAAALPLIHLVPDWLGVAADHAEPADRIKSIELVFKAAADSLSQLEVIQQSLAAIAGDRPDPHAHGD